MAAIRLYRGICVSVRDEESVVHGIKNNGLDTNEDSSWEGFLWKEQNESEKLFLKEDLSRKDTGLASRKVTTRTGFYTEYLEGNKSICFADFDGATYYACKHNYSQEKPVRLLIEADLEISSVAIDGRDFLYTAFSFLRNLPSEKLSRAHHILEDVFGPSIRRYIEKLHSHPKADPNAICDLIVCDNNIKKSHGQNKHIISGRCGTHFKSAFFVTVPIPRSQIVNVTAISGSYSLPRPTYSLSDFR